MKLIAGCNPASSFLAVLYVTALSLCCFQAINMSIQSLCYLKASRNRWFVQAGGDLGPYEMSWHSCSLGSTPTTHLSHVVHWSYSEVIVVTPSENPKLLFPSLQILTGLCSLKTVENEWSCQIQKAAFSLTTHTDGRVIMRVQHFSLEFFEAYILTFLCQPFHPPTLPLISLPLCPSVLSLLGSRQEEGPGGDQGLHHSVPGQCGLPDQCLS